MVAGRPNRRQLGHHQCHRLRRHPDRSALYPTTTVQYQSCNAVTRTRTVQPQEFNPRKNQYRNAGELTSETQNTSTLNQPRSLDCRYNTTGFAPASAWQIYGAGNTLPQYLQYDGKSLPGTLTQFQVVSAGVTYLRGASQGSKGGGSDAYQYFTVCKVLPNQP